MIKTDPIADNSAHSEVEVKAAHIVVAGSALMAAILILSQVDVVEFAIYLGLTTLVLAVVGDVYQRLGRFNLFSGRRRR